ncbi:MAG: pyridoxamine 5'-phosphate oxidase family protein [Erysipelotrichaceae bacterium]|nr:pyridoxamine 5'-phosphate oxidase family protein [Erysipelotrichaceae bacterium]
MFREVRRIKQRLNRDECIEILKKAKRGVLSVNGDNGYPYGVPLNHYYDEESGKIYFHGNMQGHKVDAIRADSRVSFCVYDDGYRVEGDWALTFKSVIVFGTVREVEDRDLILRICRNLSYKFTSDKEYIEGEIAGSGKRVLVHELTIEHMTGKKIREA